MEIQTIIFMGYSGAGKGTQLGFIETFLRTVASETPIFSIETGKYFRGYAEHEGYTWDRVRAVNNAGERQPAFLAAWIWASVFIERFHGNEHLIFDGSPRSLYEAYMLHTVFPFYGRKKPTVIFLNVSRGWSAKRLRERGRAEDMFPGNIDRKLAWFEKDVLPAVDFYRSTPEYRFLEINGEQEIDNVRQDIFKGLGFA
jgi:adenylate kinase family enzyme